MHLNVWDTLIGLALCALPVMINFKQRVRQSQAVFRVQSTDNPKIKSSPLITLNIASVQME
jgi:hypothetical protein